MKCKFYCLDVAKNGTRIKSHITNCKQFDDTIKYKYLNEANKKSNSESIGEELHESQSSNQVHNLDVIDVAMKMLT